MRHGAPVLIVVASNGAWQIEVHGQEVTRGGVRRAPRTSCVGDADAARHSRPDRVTSAAGCHAAPTFRLDLSWRLVRTTWPAPPV